MSVQRRAAKRSFRTDDKIYIYQPYVRGGSGALDLAIWEAFLLAE
jgi:hypothetical protein